MGSLCFIDPRGVELELWGWEHLEEQAAHLMEDKKQQANANEISTVTLCAQRLTG